MGYAAKKLIFEGGNFFLVSDICLRSSGTQETAAGSVKFNALAHKKWLFDTTIEKTAEYVTGKSCYTSEIYIAKVFGP